MAARAAPRDAQVRVALAQVQMAQNRHAEAVATLRGAARVLPAAPGAGRRAAREWAEVVSAYILGLQRSAFWGFAPDGADALRAALARALEAQPALLEHCGSPTHAWEVGLSPAQAAALAAAAAYKADRAAAPQRAAWAATRASPLAAWPALLPRPGPAPAPGAGAGGARLRVAYLSGTGARPVPSRPAPSCPAPPPRPAAPRRRRAGARAAG